MVKAEAAGFTWAPKPVWAPTKRGEKTAGGKILNHSNVNCAITELYDCCLFPSSTRAVAATAYQPAIFQLVGNLRQKIEETAPRMNDIEHAVYNQARNSATTTSLFDHWVTLVRLQTA